MSPDPKNATLRRLAETIHSHEDWWLFPAQDSIQGFMGTDPVFFVGDQPSKSEWPPEHPNRKAFYGVLQKIGLPNAHLTASELFERTMAGSTCKPTKMDRAFYCRMTQGTPLSESATANYHATSRPNARSIVGAPTQNQMADLSQTTQ